ncbi:MAG: hypoxanthine phosphoribosyltransferase [Chloroflexi bacterium]|nr:hypoxanthine phosphoribosyltransferase [Chloroflexota bacterium]
MAFRMTSGSPPRFAHDSEAELARILDFYGIEWRYEPDVFPISWNADGAVVESFAPDFYLPEIGMYLELTTLKQSLVAEVRPPGLPDRCHRIERQRQWRSRRPREWDHPGSRVSLHSDVEEILLDADTIAARVAELGAQLSADYADRNPVLLSVLKGAVVFLADLMRSMDVPSSIDLMELSSYGAGTETSGQVRILKDLSKSIEGRDVIVVEDIIDTGLTLNYLLRYLAERHPTSISVCCLLDKPARRLADLEIDYRGFTIPDRFVVGYGLDFDERYRNLPYIGVLKPGVYGAAPVG